MVEMDEKQARTWGMLCHILAFAGFIIPLVGNIVGPLVIWLLKREEHPFIDEQGKESVNFEITVSICLAIALGLACVGGVIILPLILPPVVVILWIVFVIIAAIKANAGEHYRYPFALRLVK